MENNFKKVLIVGASAVEYSLAKKLSQTQGVGEVFVAPGYDAMEEFCKTIDIRESNSAELLEFVLENGIDLTIASSEIAIKNDIAALFQQNSQMIFAPNQASANICLSKSAGKKFMYKNRITCPKFGIFDKPNLAIDYAKNSNLPIVIKTDEHQEKGVMVCSSFSIAKQFIEELFETGEKKVIIEDFIYGHEFSFYVITDGYHALPLGSVANYKFELDGNGGLITSGMGSYTPDYKITRQIERKILQQIIYPTLNTLNRMHTPYTGILGVDFILKDNEQLFAMEFNSFIKSPDAQDIFALLDENLYDLFAACAIGSFADDYVNLAIKDECAASCVLLSKKRNEIINGIDDLDEDTIITPISVTKNKYLEYETSKDKSFIITRTARALSKAVNDLYDEISVINYEGLRYRKDIGKNNV